MTQTEIENNEIVKGFLDRTFFKAWKNKRYLEDPKYINYATLELQITGHCDLKCTYCYYARYSDQLYPKKISGKENVLHNMDLVLNWLEENNYFPKLEVFSGEIFSTELGFQAVEKLVDWAIKIKKENIEIIIPTNFSFIFSEEKTQRVTNILEKCKINKIYLFLSCSIDGKYCDSENRPFKDGKIRDDTYYDKVFSFCKKWNFNFHPMIYSNKIEKWKDNWLWFQEMMAKHEIDFRSIYLLEVRNAEWTKQQLKEYYNFIRFLTEWIISTLISKKAIPRNDVFKYIQQNRLFNAFNMFSSAGRGIGCSIQSAAQLRLGDLTTSLCHRASYKQHNLWKFKVENDRIVDVEGINTNLLVAMESASHDVFPMCENCFIKNVCTYQCLGSMYETNKEPMLPIPSVCALEHIKIAAVYDELYKLRFQQEFSNFASHQKYQTMKIYYKYFHKGE